MLNRTSKGSGSLEIAVSVVVVMAVAIGVYTIQHSSSVKDQAAISTIMVDSSSSLR